MSVSINLVTGAATEGIYCAPVDVCKVPAGAAPFVPIPYPNTAPPLAPATTARAKSPMTRSTMYKGDEATMYTGDEAGTLMGSQKRVGLMQNLQIAGFTATAAKAMAEGAPVQGSADKMLLYSYLNRRLNRRSSS